MKVSSLLLTLLTVALLLGFTSCCSEISCSSGRLSVFGLINFSNGNNDLHYLDSAVVRRFPKDSTFDLVNKLDSFKLIDYHSVSGVENDTALVTITDDAPFYITTGYKYELYIPATQTSIQVDSLQDQPNVQESCSGTEYKKLECVAPLTKFSVTVNGTYQPNTSQPQTYQIVYVTKPQVTP